MDLLISEMEKLLDSGREDIQDIIGESAGKDIDDLLVEADKLICETLPYFQTTLNVNQIESSKVFESIKESTKKNNLQHKSRQNDTKKVVFNLKHNSSKVPERLSKSSSDVSEKPVINKYIKGEERKINNNQRSSPKSCMMLNKFKVPEVNFLRKQSQVNSTLIENHNRLQIMCNKYEKLATSTENTNQSSQLKMEEELNYYKVKNDELEKNLITKEQEIRVWENRYQKLNDYCELFLKKEVEETLQKYDCQLKELIDRNTTRESQLHAIIISLLEEIDKSHMEYRVKLFEKNEQIRKYLDQIEKILKKVNEYRNRSTSSTQV